MAAEVEQRVHSGEGMNPSASLLSGAVTHEQLLEMIGGKANADDVYTKTETDNKLSGKAAKATTLSGYGITDAYTKTETDNKFAALPVLLFNGGIPYLCDALKDSGGNSVLDSGQNEVVSRVRLNTDGGADILLTLENRIGELERRVYAALGHVIHDSAFKM